MSETMQKVRAFRPSQFSDRVAVEIKQDTEEARAARVAMYARRARRQQPLFFTGSARPKGK